MFCDARKLYITKTHTALQNVIRNLGKNFDNCDFEIIDSITRSNSAVVHDIVFIDECSTIDNRTMELLLGKISNDALIVMSGDVYQIESIDFGNWFFYAKDIVKAKGGSIELCSTWRTKKEELKGLWKAVREKSTIITEMLSMDGPFSENLGENIFHLDEDEVVLCLNYDGKFGLNNMNQYFQNANTNSKAFSWEEWSYKIGDRIIFINTRRSALLYNNLRGIITNIAYAEKSIIFEIEVKAFFTESQCEAESFDYVDTTEKGTIIRIEVISWDDELSEEEKVKTVIPFQLSYAISIHKAQGLPFHQGVGSYGARFVQDDTYSTSFTKVAEANSILFSVRAPVGRLNITKNKIVIGRGIAAINSKSGFQSYLFYALKERFFKDDILGNGAIFASISKNELLNQVFVIPDEKIMSAYEKIAAALDKKIEVVDMQLQQLVEARDRLLPKLMNGEIEV